MTEIEIDYVPHEKQLPFHESRAKYRLLCTGAGFGKTAAGVVELIMECMRSKSGTWWAMAAPTYRMLTTATVREFMKFCPREIIKNYNRSEQIITLINDVSIVGVAGDREDTIDRVRGLTLGGAYGDEIARSSEYMHEMLVARVRDPGGSLRIWYTTTPKGRTWLKRLFEDKKTKDDSPIKDPENYEIFKGSTLDNPHTPKEYKDSLLNTYVGVFRQQEIFGEFVGFEGLVYPNFSRSVHVVDAGGMERDGKFKEFKGFVDFGFTNPSVILKVGFDYDGRAYVVQEFYQSKTTDSQLAQIAKSHFGAMQYVADSSNPGGIEEFRKAGLDCRGASKVTGEHEDSYVMAGIKVIFQMLDTQPDGMPRLFVDKSCVNTIMEFENYRYPDDREGKPLQERPIKLFDHTMDALRYGLVTRDIPLFFGIMDMTRPRPPAPGEPEKKDEKNRIAFG